MFDSYIDRAFGTESSYNPLAKNPRSSATGLGQFTDGTWQSLINAYPELGLTPDGRTDPAQARRAMEQFTFDNASILKKNGHEPTDNNLYAMHRFGVSGGPKLLGSDPNAPIESVVSPDVLKANPDLPGKTVGQVLNRWTDDASGLTDVSAQRRQPGSFAAPSAPTTVFRGKRDAPTPDDAGYSFANFQRNAPDAFMAAGAGLASISNPQQAAALAQVAKIGQGDDQWQVIAQPQTGALIRINKKTGQVQTVQGGIPVRSEADKAYDTKMGQHWADLNEKISNTAANSQASLGQLDALRGALSNPNVYKGFGGESVLQLKKAAQAVGFNVEGIADSELASKISKGLALELRNPSGGAGMPGALSDSDRKYLTQMVASLDNSETGNNKILDLYQAMHQRNVEIDRKRAEYEAQHGRIDAGFVREVRDWANQNPLFKNAPAPASTSGGGGSAALKQKYGLE